MLKRLLTLVSLSVLLGAGPAHAASIVFRTTLAPEVMGSSGFGFAEVIFDTDAHTLFVTFEFNDLAGPTTVSHIHCCVDPPGTVGVATFPVTFPDFPSGLFSGSYTSPAPIDLTDEASYTGSFLTNFGGGTAAGAEAALLAGMLAGRSYLNVHSEFSPPGEIRGFLHPVPEPTTLLLLGSGLALAARARRRHQRP